ncbi:MAG: cbb3-type cytochrome oxidase assembly protein CcoS [Burkholderiales bacterium]|nr:cbb3-type cytochrome oxidase assembly protein CcoS [Burkholderiales bacterium]
MESLYLLIPLSVVLVFVIGIAFWWSVRSGQFDDMEGPAYRILMDDDRVRPAAPDTPTAKPDAASPQPRSDD